jgi:hypothetical protein
MNFDNVITTPIKVWASISPTSKNKIDFLGQLLIEIVKMTPTDATTLLEHIKIHPLAWHSRSLHLRAKRVLKHQLLVTHFCRCFEPSMAHFLGVVMMSHLED